MNIFISGSTSILAATLIEYFFRQGHVVYVEDSLPDNPLDSLQTVKNVTAGQPMDLVFLLHAEDIFSSKLGRFSLPEKARNIIVHTEAVCRYFASCSVKPQAIFCASSVHIYRQRLEEKSYDNGPIGTGFPAEFFAQLETVIAPIRQSDIRVLDLRFGRLVSTQSEPAFPSLPFRTRAIATPFNEKKIGISWVSCEDALRAILFLLENEHIDGAINITSGDILSRAEFNDIVISRYRLRRTSPISTKILRLLGGKEAAGLLLSGSRAVPFKLLEAGFFFEDISLQEYILGKES